MWCFLRVKIKAETFGLHTCMTWEKRTRRREGFWWTAKKVCRSVLRFGCHKISVTRWLYCLFNIWPLTRMKFARKHKKLNKVGLIFCQIQNKLTKTSQRLLKFRHSGDILPNLVTLATTCTGVCICVVSKRER